MEGLARPDRYTRDSPPYEDKYLIIIFYDILLLDNILYLYEPLHLRRRRLETLISYEADYTEIGERMKIDLRHPNGKGRPND